MGGAYRGKGCKGTGFALKPGSSHCVGPEVRRFSDAGTHDTSHALRRPASEKRQGTKSRWGNVGECRNYGDFAAGGKVCERVILHR